MPEGKKEIFGVFDRRRIPSSLPIPLIIEDVHMRWIPKQIRYTAILPCSVCGEDTLHEEVIKGRWRCKCRESVIFEDKSSGISDRLPTRAYRGDMPISVKEFNKNHPSAGQSVVTD